MTKKEAHLFFPHEENDDLDDLWEDRLFEQKQFFLTRPPLRKVFLSRLDKLKKQYHAYLALKEENDSIVGLESTHNLQAFSKNIIQAFNLYHTERNKFKHELLQATDFPTVQNVVRTWLDMEKWYAEQWRNEKCHKDELTVIKSKEPDPMILLEELKKLSNNQNIYTFEDLKKGYNELNDIVRKEVKRLTLLAEE